MGELGYQELKDIIAKQEQMVRVERFTAKDAHNLGCFLIEEAEKQGISVAICVRKATGAILFHHLMEGTNLDNQLWMKRKFNTVMLTEHSSLMAWASEQLTDESVTVHGLSTTEYVFVGGGFPIYLKSGELVGSLIISNLPHMSDHQFAVDGLAKWAGIENVPSVV